MFSADKCLAPGFHPSRLCAVAAGDSSSRCRCPVKTHLSLSDLYACVYVYILYKSIYIYICMYADIINIHVCVYMYIYIYKHMYLSLSLCLYQHHKHVCTNTAFSF